TLDLSAPSSLLFIKNGITFNDFGGAGPGTVNVTGAGSAIFAEGTETLDNATIDLGSNGGAASIFNVATNRRPLNEPVVANAVLTLGSNLTINHVGQLATLDSKDFSGDSTPGVGIVNQGTINAALNGGTFSIDAPSSTFPGTTSNFTNFGKIVVANGDS